jgi:hypothetical protein
MLERKRRSGARTGELLRKTNRTRAGLPQALKRRSVGTGDGTSEFAPFPFAPGVRGPDGSSPGVTWRRRSLPL